MTRANDYSEEELINGVKIGREHCEGRYTLAKYRKLSQELDLPSAYAVTSRIGWNKAKEKAGLDITKHSRKYDWEELRECYKTGMTLNEICEKFGINRTYLSNILDDLLDKEPQICRDCIYQPTNCREDIQDCIKEAKLYNYFDEEET